MLYITPWGDVTLRARLATCQVVASDRGVQEPSQLSLFRGSLEQCDTMALMTVLSLFRTAALVVIVAVLAYRLRSSSFRRTVLTGNGGLFEDSLDTSGERYHLSCRLSVSTYRTACLDGTPLTDGCVAACSAPCMACCGACSLTPKLLPRRRSFSYRTDAEKKRWFVMDSLVRPGMAGALPGKSASPPLHIHPHQQECFLVRCGCAVHASAYATLLIPCTDRKCTKAHVGPDSGLSHATATVAKPAAVVLLTPAGEATSRSYWTAGRAWWWEAPHRQSSRSAFRRDTRTPFGMPGTPRSWTWVRNAPSQALLLAAAL